MLGWGAGMDFGVWLRSLLFFWSWLPFLHFHRDYLPNRLLLIWRRVLCPDGLRQDFLPGVGHRPVSLVQDSVWLPKGDAPLEKKL